MLAVMPIGEVPTMGGRAVVLAAVLLMAPLGARGADMIVWWEQGFYPQADEAIREIIAAFEQQTGKHVEIVFQPPEGMLA
jgi:ABC-type glycerol-3-phosphate transport system substrate-binding protein